MKKIITFIGILLGCMSCSMHKDMPNLYQIQQEQKVNIRDGLAAMPFRSMHQEYMDVQRDSLVNRMDKETLDSDTIIIIENVFSMYPKYNATIYSSASGIAMSYPAKSTIHDKTRELQYVLSKKGEETWGESMFLIWAIQKGELEQELELREKHDFQPSTVCFVTLVFKDGRNYNFQYFKTKTYRPFPDDYIDSLRKKGILE